MQSPAFTLIEILITLTIFIFLATVGLFFSFDYYKTYAFNSERNTILSALEQARGQSMDNINQATHGVHFEAGKYIVFQCAPACNSYSPGSSDLAIPAGYKINITAPALPFDVIFSQLSGTTTQANLQLSDGGVNASTISINSQGQIDW